MFNNKGGGGVGLMSSLVTSYYLNSTLEKKQLYEHV